MVDKKLLAILACPVCKADVAEKKKGKKEYLICTKCTREYEVKDGIPIMLVEED
ncbi:hypothetical protein COT72_03640 [archaeon CG10_big_fil_rev_8_21_14_0_10_43_11]|nr:MAG: hypothetical protein COT72_03640 [archaeon CG10_big_fil_rev_8_21_14_0_10_43_11]